jgi:hypothetical protein
MDKEEFIKELKQKVNELNYRYSIERNKFESKAQHLGAEARKTYEEEAEKLRRLSKQMKARLVDLDVAGENAWHDVKEGAEDAWKAFNTAIKKASSRFK